MNNELQGTSIDNPDIDEKIDYYDVSEISKIILVDEKDIINVVENNKIYGEIFQKKCKNKIVENNTTKYHYDIIKDLDEIINGIFMARYKKRYQEEITEPFNDLVEKHRKKRRAY